jgi:glucose-6-phosphate isomerase
MSNLIEIDLGHLIDDSNSRNFLTNSEFDQFPDRFGCDFENIRKSLEDETSRVTRSLDLDESDYDRFARIAETIRTKYDNVLVIGIGGSTLGFRAILQAMRGPYFNYDSWDREYPRVFVVDNIDPVIAAQLTDRLDFKMTTIIYISKSGSTPESAANFIHFFDRCSHAGSDPADMTFICDPGDNGINNIAKNLGCNLLHIPPDLGGRYSVLSAVGLLPSEIIGLSSPEFIRGARSVHDVIVKTPLEKNALFAVGSCLQTLFSKGKSIHVMFSYGNSLSDFGLWFVQLWAESLGKRFSTSGEEVFAGTTPLASLGATDQHSILQLFKEGPNDKVLGFVSVRDYEIDITLPGRFSLEVEYAYFAGHTLEEQLGIEMTSTEISLVNAGKPCYKIEIADLSPTTFGGLFYFMECLTVYVAELSKVNPFDQPGVEDGKNMTYALMGRQDHAAKRQKHEEALSEYQKRTRKFAL